jgi:hypothetical protein
MCLGRAGEGVHDGAEQNAAVVSAGVHEAGDERQEDAEGPEEAAERQLSAGKRGVSKVSKKTLAQNILKNQRFILKYKNLDAQLQNTMFEY